MHKKIDSLVRDREYESEMIKYKCEKKERSSLLRQFDVSHFEDFIESKDYMATVLAKCSSIAPFLIDFRLVSLCDFDVVFILRCCVTQGFCNEV